MTGGEPYRTVAGRGRVAFEIRSSAFVGYAAPTESTEGAETFVASIEADHPDASHVVPAYRVREGELVRAWSSDDGEPAGSAGAPALNVLERRELENVVAAIVRHFGGTELGVGGLARAYARAASGAVDDAGMVERDPHEAIAITTAYDDSGTVRGILESADVPFEADYGEAVRFDARVPIGDAASVCDRIRSATSGRAEIEREE